MRRSGSRRFWLDGLRPYKQNCLSYVLHLYPMKRLATLTLISVIGMPLLGYSQSFNLLRQDRNFLVSIGSGTANYYGEMVNPGEFGKLKPNIALGAEYYLNSRISARAELTWFQLSGNDSKANDSRKVRNLSFTSNCIEFS